MSYAKERITKNFVRLPASELNKIIIKVAGGSQTQNSNLLDPSTDSNLKLALRKLSYEITKDGHKKFVVDVKEKTEEERILARESFKTTLARKIFAFCKKHRLANETENHLLCFLDEANFESAYNQLAH